MKRLLHILLSILMFILAYMSYVYLYDHSDTHVFIHIILLLLTGLSLIVQAILLRVGIWRIISVIWSVDILWMFFGFITDIVMSPDSGLLPEIIISGSVVLAVMLVVLFVIMKLKPELNKSA